MFSTLGKTVKDILSMEIMDENGRHGYVKVGAENGHLIFGDENCNPQNVSINLNIKLLDKKTVLTDELLYSMEDFVVLPYGNNGRVLVEVKIGNLFIKYTPEGKGSFTGEIFYINKEKPVLEPLFKMEQYRYAYTDFSPMFPFHLDSFYDAMTSTAPPFVRERPIPTQSNAVNNLEKCLLKLKELFIDMALEKKEQN